MPEQKIAIRKLQGDESSRNFKAEYLIPLSPLVEALGDQLAENVRKEIDVLIDATAHAYGAGSA